MEMKEAVNQLNLELSDEAQSPAFLESCQKRQT